MSIWLLVDKVEGRVVSYYYKKVFLARIGQRAPKAQDCTVLGKMYVNATNLTLRKNVTLYPGVYFWGGGEIVIGDNCDIGKDTIIFASGEVGVRIGSDVNIAAQCFIIDSNHGMRRDELIRRQPLESRGVVIGNDMWISAQCAAIKGAEIRDGAVIRRRCVSEHRDSLRKCSSGDSRKGHQRGLNEMSLRTGYASLPGGRGFRDCGAERLLRPALPTGDAPFRGARRARLWCGVDWEWGTR